jgi:hypothetical protein
MFLGIYEAKAHKPKWRIPLDKCEKRVENTTVFFTVPALVVDETFTAEIWLERETDGIPSAHDPLGMRRQIVPVQRVDQSRDITLTAGSVLHVTDWKITLT